MTNQNIQSCLRTKLSRSNSSPSKNQGPKRRDVLSKDELDHLLEEVESKFDDMPEAKRVAAFRKFWEMDYGVTKLDKKTNCNYRSAPLMRAFTICHDELAQGYFRFKGKKLSTQQDIAVAVQAVKRSIRSTIRRLEGVVEKSDGPMHGAPDTEDSTRIFNGFREGFGSDDYLIGMFFSEAGRTKAIEDVVSKWGQYGVRTEPVHDEQLVENGRNYLWQLDFDRKAFRKQFAKLSHEDRLTAIEDLASKGINLNYTDRKTDIVYRALNGFVRVGASFNSSRQKGKNSREFTYPFTLGYSEESLPSPSEQFDEIDGVERTLLGIIAKHNGFVMRIVRTLPKDSLGSGDVDVRFPSEAAKRSASKEVFEKLSVYDVKFQRDSGEVLSIDEQIAEANQELDSSRDDIDSYRERLKLRKERHRENEIRIEESESAGPEPYRELVRKGILRADVDCCDLFKRLLKSSKEGHCYEEIRIKEIESDFLEREEEHKKLERTTAERVKHLSLSRERMECSDGDSMGNE